ncbi:MAG TPA: hypothetical protein QF730_00965 [Planctomycetota bacterium]|jgi:hypothetical protein|nr:hypothetical protein [Planctomycetota bacterium]
MVREQVCKTHASLGWSHELIAATFGRGVWKRTILSKPIVFVDKTNSGAEDGSFEHPYQDLTSAVGAAPADAIIALRTNTYNEAQTIPVGMTLVTWGGITVIR